MHIKGIKKRGNQKKIHKYLYKRNKLRIERKNIQKVCRKGKKII